jgi:Co/Zn/Cd efflux system component
MAQSCLARIGHPCRAAVLSCGSATGPAPRDASDAAGTVRGGSGPVGGASLAPGGVDTVESMPSLDEAHRGRGIAHSHAHRHGPLTHSHPHVHAAGIDHDDPATHDHHHPDHLDHVAGQPSQHGHGHEHGHSHGPVDRSIVRSRAGLKAVSLSLVVLLVSALIQLGIFRLSGSVALLADLIHNAGDAATAIPLAIAFLLRSARGERLAGLVVVAAIFISACVAAIESIGRLIHPQQLSHLWALTAAGAVGFVGNEIAAQVRLRAGRRLDSPALIADGKHARIDGFVSLGVIGSAALVAVGAEAADPVIGLAITAIILKITWDAWHTVRASAVG